MHSLTHTHTHTMLNRVPTLGSVHASSRKLYAGGTTKRTLAFKAGDESERLRAERLSDPEPTTNNNPEKGSPDVGTGDFRIHCHLLFIFHESVQFYSYGAGS